MKDKDAKALLRGKRVGTFLVRFSKNHDKFYINIKTKRGNTKKNAEAIKKAEVFGVTYYFFHKGFSFTSILALIQNKESRDEYNLLYPLNCEESLNEGQEQEQELEARSTEIENMPSSFNNQEVPNDVIDDDAETCDYFHGNLSEEEIEIILGGRPKGSFLLRFVVTLNFHKVVYGIFV